MEKNKEVNQMTFDQLYDELQYFGIEDTIDKYPEVVADEIRDYIRDAGWDCLDEYDTEEEWLEEHPEYDENDCKTFTIADLEFLCENKYPCGHDVDWHEFNISFYGKWGEFGTFIVSL